MSIDVDYVYNWIMINCNNMEHRIYYVSSFFLSSRRAGRAGRAGSEAKLS